MLYVGLVFFFFQAEDGIRDLVRSRGLGDVYKRQDQFEGVIEVRQTDSDGDEIVARKEVAVRGSRVFLSLIHI